MRKGIILLAGLLLVGCGNAPTPVRVETNSNANVGPANTQPSSMIEHGPSLAATPPAANAPKTKWTQSGDPIDTAKFDEAVNAASKTAKAKPADAAAKKALSEAYFDRGSALVEARQYASALGDYRKALKADSTNTEAKDWIDKIIVIYDGLNKEAPKDGEEPPPLPFKKEK